MKIDISDEVFEKIGLNFKKAKNKIIFLEYFDENLKKFKRNDLIIENLNILRIFIQKLKIVFILKIIRAIILKPIILKPNSGGVWRIEKELSEYLQINENIKKEFMELLNDAMKKYNDLLNTLVNEIIECERKINRSFMEIKFVSTKFCNY